METTVPSRAAPCVSVMCSFAAPCRSVRCAFAAPCRVDVEKTGGSGVMKWLHKQVNRGNSTQLSALFDFCQTSCFFALFPDVFPGYAADGWDPRRCTAPAAPDWRTASIAVEFHGYTRNRYWEQVVPVLPALRKLYEGAGGRLVTSAMLREPVKHLISSYHMWPPNRRSARGAGKHVVPLLDWLPRASGLQAGSIAMKSYTHPRRGFINPQGCSAVLDVARARCASTAADAWQPSSPQRAVQVRTALPADPAATPPRASQDAHVRRRRPHHVHETRHSCRWNRARLAARREQNGRGPAPRPAPPARGRCAGRRAVEGGQAVAARKPERHGAFRAARRGQARHGPAPSIERRGRKKSSRAGTSPVLQGRVRWMSAARRCLRAQVRLRALPGHADSAALTEATPVRSAS